MTTPVAAPDGAQPWCRAWWTADHHWRDPARVKRMLDAMVAAGLHRLPPPNFVYHLCAGYYDSWSIRLAWQDDRSRTNVFIHLIGEIVHWSLEIVPLGDGDIRASRRKSTFEQVQADVGVDIIALYGQD